MLIPRSTICLVLLAIVITISLPALSQVVIATLPAGTHPNAVAVNAGTNKIYVANQTCDTIPCPGPGTVTVIDGATNTTTTVNVGVYPNGVAVNPVTNKIYVTNKCGLDVNCASLSTVTIIDGATNATATVPVGYAATAIAVNSVTNEAYVSNACGSDVSCTGAGTVTSIGGTNNTSTVIVGYEPVSVAVNATTNQIYVANQCGDDSTCASAGTVTAIEGAGNATSTINVGFVPSFLDVNAATNEIYVANKCGTDSSCASAGTVTVIDGATKNTVDVIVGFSPNNLAINGTTNKIYVSNYCGNDVTCHSLGTVTMINGATNNTHNIAVGVFPFDVAVNATTNKVYVANLCGSDLTCLSAGTVTVIDGASNDTLPVAVGDGPVALAVNATTNTTYTTNSPDDSVSVIGNATTLQLVNVTPCRVVDTRNANGTFGGPPIQGGTFRSFPIPQGDCSIPSTAAAYSLNVTVVPSGRLGFLTIWPSGEIQPLASLMNSLDARIKANAAIVPAGVDAAVSVFASDTTNVVIDIDGYFAPADATTLAFYPLTPCRVVDTRNADGDLGGPFLQANMERDFPIPESSCIPSGVTPQAYSFNVTVVPNPANQRLGFLTVWPVGEQQPLVSTLNNLTGTVVANAAIVPAGTDGAVAVFPNNTTDLVVDINGYFALPGQGGLSLYPNAPCRVIDTRNVGNGDPFTGELTVDVAGSRCGPPSNAQAYVFNATVVPPGALGFLTLWPDGESQPLVSTLNATDGAITSNMAIVPTTNGSIDAYASALTQLVLDISSYFAP